MEKKPRKKAIKSPKNKMIKCSPEVKVEEVEEVDPQEKKQLTKIGQAIQSQEPLKLNRAQVELVKRTVARGATDDELKLFISVCQSAGLNPFLRQIHLVPRWDSKEGKEIRTIQVGIDGFRSIAEGSGKYAGSDDAIFGEDIEIKAGKIKNEETGLLEDNIIEVPVKATVAVYKLMEGTRYPFTATARWSEYYPGGKQGYMWHKMPYGQLGKCAEALALRKAFPKQLSGIYITEEMQQAKEERSDDIGVKEDRLSAAKLAINNSTNIDKLKTYKTKIIYGDYTDIVKKELELEIDKRIQCLEQENTSAGAN